jgi:hypothetical protein
VPVRFFDAVAEHVGDAGVAGAGDYLVPVRSEGGILEMGVTIY